MPKPLTLWKNLNTAIVTCERCPRLREHCAHTATTKRAAYRDWTYHGRPVPNFGDPAGRLLIVGLAPGAHGANRTGRMFTGDRSGDFLYKVMHDAGFASQPESTDVNDGLALRDVAITAAGHCAPPGNKPLPEELANCAPFLTRTMDTMSNLKAVLCLGGLAQQAVLREYRGRGWIKSLKDYPFGHGVEHAIAGAPHILCAYHPSQQNTFTGRLTEPMLLKVFLRAREVIER